MDENAGDTKHEESAKEEETEYVVSENGIKNVHFGENVPEDLEPELNTDSSEFSAVDDSSSENDARLSVMRVDKHVENIVTVEDDTDPFDNINGNDLVQNTQIEIVQSESVDKVESHDENDVTSNEEPMTKDELATETGESESISLVNRNHYKLSLDTEQMSDVSSGFENISSRTEEEKNTEKTVDLDNELVLRSGRRAGKLPSDFSDFTTDDTTTTIEAEARTDEGVEADDDTSVSRQEETGVRSYNTGVTSASNDSIVYSSCISRVSPDLMNAELANFNSNNKSSSVDLIQCVLVGEEVNIENFEENLNLFTQYDLSFFPFSNLPVTSALTQASWSYISTSLAEVRYNMPLIWLKQDNFCLSINEMIDELSVEDIQDDPNLSTVSGSMSVMRAFYDSPEIRIKTAEPLQTAALSLTETGDILDQICLLGDLVSETVSRSEIRNRFAHFGDLGDPSYISHSEFYNVSFEKNEKSDDDHKRLNLEDLESFDENIENIDMDNFCSSYAPLTGTESMIESVDLEELSEMHYNHYVELDKFEIPVPTTESMILVYYTSVAETNFYSFYDGFEETNKDLSGIIRPIYPFRFVRTQSYYQWFIKNNGFDAMFGLHPFYNLSTKWEKLPAKLEPKRVKTEHVEVFTGQIPGQNYKDTSFLQSTTQLNLNLNDPSKFSTPLPLMPKLDNLADTERLGYNITEELSFFTRTNPMQGDEHCSLVRKNDCKQKIALETELKDECLIEMLDVQSWKKSRDGSKPNLRGSDDMALKPDNGIEKPGTSKPRKPGSKEKRSFDKVPACKGDVDRTTLLVTNMDNSLSSMLAQQDFSSITLDISTDRTIHEELHRTLEPSASKELLPKGLSASLRVPPVPARTLKNPRIAPGSSATLEKSKNKYVTKWLAKNEREFIRLNCLKIRPEDLSTTVEHSRSFDARKEPRRLSFQASSQSHDSRRDPKKSKTSRSMKKRSLSLPYQDSNFTDVPLKVMAKRKSSEYAKIESETIKACLESLRLRLKSKYEQEYLGKLFDQMLLENICQFRERTLSSVQLSKVLARYDSSFSDLNLKGKQEVVEMILEDTSVRIDSKTLLKRLIKQPKTSSSNTLTLTKQH